MKNNTKIHLEKVLSEESIATLRINNLHQLG